MRMLSATAHRLIVPSRKNPAAGAVETYLGRLGAGSRRTGRQSLDVVAAVLGADAESGCNAVAWHRLRREDLLAIRKALARQYAPSTANKMLSLIRGVLRTCCELGLMNQDDCSAATSVGNVPAIYHPQGEELRCVGADEMNALLAVCEADGGPAGWRDAALIAILLGTGLRRVEAVALDLDDFHMKRIDRAMLHIRGEQPERDRLVHLARDVAESIRAWLDVRSDDPGPLLLPVNKSGAIIDRRMTDQAVYDIVRRLAIRANVPHVTTRALRRTYVAALIASGLPLETVRELAGHASWVTTNAYSELATEMSSRDVRPFKRFLPRVVSDRSMRPRKENHP